MNTLKQALETIFANFAVKQTETFNEHYAQLVEKNITERKKVNEYLRFFRSGRLFYKFENVAFRIIDQEEANQVIKDVVEANVLAFRARIESKLDWLLELDSAEVTTVSIGSIYDYVMLIKIGDVTFTLCGDVVVNHSPAGTQFMQYPITFRHGRIGGDKGTKIPAGELNLKKAISAFVRETSEGVK